ncbi:hypothetical protein BC826DRAFT_971129 [Russula brevipes]|nr:hypothetical protein BC826DRAFT_971129 [Russula brevipes]
MALWTAWKNARTKAPHRDSSVVSAEGTWNCLLQVIPGPDTFLDFVRPLQHALERYRILYRKSLIGTFFHTAYGHMHTQDYHVFIEKLHRCFHPDRWSVRGLLERRMNKGL